MPRIMYEKWNPQAAAVEVVQRANAICADYAARGYDLTLRQLYYQFVARDLLPNTSKSYDRLGSIVNKARLAGMLDWDYITDRTRNLDRLPHWDDPGDVVASAARSFGQDLWANQSTRVEVWVEKEALAGVVGRAAEQYDCAFFSCRGYVSQSEMWAAAQRLGRYIEGGQNVVILHLGDHDPSGIDMTRDIRERLDQFLVQDYLNAHGDEFPGGRAMTSTIRMKMAERCGMADQFDAMSWGALEVRRIALTRDQIDEYEPPPNPAKQTDARFESYLREHGDESWELDALDPQVLDDLITEHIESIVDVDVYEEARAAQERHREILNTASSRWDEIVEYLEGEDAA